MNNNEITLHTDVLDEGSSAFLDGFKKIVIGQPQAEKVALAAFESINNPLRDRNRPIGVYALIGPSRTGKTYTARALARLIHGDAEALTKINCGDYVNEHQLLDLKGAPPSYVGYADPKVVKTLDDDEVDGTSKLSPHNLKRVRLNSKSEVNIVVLDEFEKAASECYRFFMGVFDDGLTTFGNGIEGDFTNTIFILTMNLGMDKVESLARGAIGFNRDNVRLTEKDIENVVRKEMERRFKPEFRNRLDQIVVFRPHEHSELLAIVEAEVKEIQKRIILNLPEAKHFVLAVDEAGARFLLDEASKDKNDVAALKRTMSAHILSPLAREMAKGSIRLGDRVTVSCSGEGNLTFKVLKGDAIFELSGLRKEHGVKSNPGERQIVSVEGNSYFERRLPESAAAWRDRHIFDLFGTAYDMHTARSLVERIEQSVRWNRRIDLIDIDFVQNVNVMYVVTVDATEADLMFLLNEFDMLKVKRR